MDIQMMLAALPGKSATRQPGNAPAAGQFAQSLASAGQRTGGDLATLAASASATPTAQPPPQTARANALAEALAAHGLSMPGADAPQLELPQAQQDLEAIVERLESIMADASAAPPQPGQEGTPLPRLEDVLTDLADDPSLDAATAQAIEAAIQSNEASAQTADDTSIAALQQALAALAGGQRQATAGERAAEARPGIAAPAQPATGTPADALLNGQGREAKATDRGGPQFAAKSLEPTPLDAKSLDVRAAETAWLTARQNAGSNGLGSESGRAVANEAMAALTSSPAGPQGSFTQAMASATAATTGTGMPGQASLSAPVQSPAWPGQLGQQLVQFARQGGEQHIEMRLHPAELGPLSVTLKMTEQGAQAQFLSAHAQVRQVIEQAIPQLREALAEQGIDLNDTSVGEQRQQEGQAFAGNEEGSGRGTAGQGELADEGLARGDGTPPAGEGMSDIALDGRVNLYA
ncbi:flagellar hook-length control protein FliK [Halomonas sp. NO4]|uniref:flagellar hook-length control protein FliK n=1 Tax=Halomonas sp. NO4 TaxID=2484813 RepID=UPI0013CF75EE|nr:flagellar hook-length control protein FliK [Halomonas sp. NO4]